MAQPSVPSFLSTKLFDLPSFSPANETPRTGIFRSLIARFLFGLWVRRLAPGGKWFVLATILFGLYGLSSLEVQALVPMSYVLGVWLLAYVTRWIEKPRFDLSVRHPDRIAAGETLPVDATLTGRKKRAGGEALLWPHRLPVEIAVEPAQGAPIPPLSNGETAKARFFLRPSKRGVYRLHGFRAESDFPFGLLQSAQIFPLLNKLTVYPRFEPLERLELPMGRRYQPGGVAFAAPRGESLEYIGNRDYREGDAVRDIDWRATARLSRPIVREYREEYFLRAAIVLDTHIPRGQLDKLCPSFERAVSLCAACGDWMTRSDYLVDVLAAGPDLYHLMAGRGLASLDQMLDILACVDASPNSPWQTLEPAIWDHLEQITSVICLFLDWDEERRAFATRVGESGAAVKVVVVRDSLPTLDPRDSWPGEVVIVGREEFESGVRFL